MIDIHHHLIYGVDDGSPIWKLAGHGARSREEGITHIVCTPHASDEYPYRGRGDRRAIRRAARAARRVVELSLGCDFHMSADNIFEALANPLALFDQRQGIPADRVSQYLTSLRS